MLKLGGMMVAAATLAVAAPVAAAETINFGAGGTANNGGKNWTSGGVNVHVTAWAISNSNVVAANLGQWSEGLGVAYGSGDEHTIDNNGNGEFILLQFDRAVTLRDAAFNTGWWNMNDTDASISYANVNYAAAGTNYNSTNAAFWGAAGAQLTANFYSAGSTGASGNNTRGINPTGVTGNTWLIAASLSNPDKFKDSYKLRTVRFDVAAAVPEPGTWAMMIAGFGFVGGAMRRTARTRSKVRAGLAFA